MRRRWLVVGIAAWAIWPAAAPGAQVDAWEIQPTPEVPGAQRSSLLGVSCAAPKACTAVGFSEGAAAGIRALALAHDGRRWSLQPTPEPAGARYAVLRDVACPGRRSCVAVGDFERSPGLFRPYIIRWDGRTWAAEATPEIPGAILSTLHAVSCPAARDCIAVGEQVTASGARTLALRWDGSAWAVVPTAERGGTTFSALADVACARRGYCVAVGQASVANVPRTLIERWDGSTWRLETAQDPPALRQLSLTGVSCPRPGACVAVGFYEASLGGFATLAEHQDGASWTQRPTPPPAGATLGGVSCPAPRRCIAVGGGGGPLAIVWDGASWTQQATPTPPGATEALLFDVDCPRRRVCVAVGTSSIGPDVGRTLAMSLGV